jgi:hypothetical protein
MTDDTLLPRLLVTYHRALSTADPARNVTMQALAAVVAEVRAHDAPQLAAARVAGLREARVMAGGAATLAGAITNIDRAVLGAERDCRIEALAAGGEVK